VFRVFVGVRGMFCFVVCAWCVVRPCVDKGCLRYSMWCLSCSCVVSSMPLRRCRFVLLFVGLACRIGAVVGHRLCLVALWWWSSVVARLSSSNGRRASKQATAAATATAAPTATVDIWPDARARGRPGASAAGACAPLVGRRLRLGDPCLPRSRSVCLSVLSLSCLVCLCLSLSVSVSAYVSVTAVCVCVCVGLLSVAAPLLCPIDSPPETKKGSRKQEG
jgi:hypothetical protein